jgi:hypothetical protein
VTDLETIEAARKLFASDTPGDKLARRLIEIIELRDLTIVAEVEHSHRLENKLRACDEIAFRNAR